MAFGFLTFIFFSSGLTLHCSYIIGISTWPPPKTRLPIRYVFSNRLIGFLFGHSFFLAVSLRMAAVMKMIPKSQKFHHLIFLGFCSICGIRFRLKLVAMPAETINVGITQGCPNRK